MDKEEDISTVLLGLFFSLASICFVSIAVYYFIAAILETDPPLIDFVISCAASLIALYLRDIRN